MLHHGLWGAVLHQDSLWFPCYFFILYFFLLNIPSFLMLPFLVFLSFKVDWNKLFFFSHTCAEEIKSSHLFIYFIFSCLIMIFLLFLNSLPFCNAFVFLSPPFALSGAGCLPTSGREREQNVLCHHRPVKDQQHVPLQPCCFPAPLPEGSPGQEGNF